MATLTGANAYTIETPEGSATYQKGETIREVDLALVPKADRKLFTDADSAPAKGSSGAATSPKTTK